MCICVHISAFQISSYNSVYPIGVWPCVHGEAQAMVREARFWTIIADTYDIHGYEQICSCEYWLKSVEEIFTDMNRYEQIHAHLNNGKS